MRTVPTDRRQKCRRRCTAIQIRGGSQSGSCSGSDSGPRFGSGSGLGSSLSSGSGWSPGVEYEMITPTAYSRLLKYSSMLDFRPESNFNLVSRRPESDSSITQVEICGGGCIQESAQNHARRTSEPTFLAPPAIWSTIGCISSSSVATFGSRRHPFLSN